MSHLMKKNNKYDLYASTEYRAPTQEEYQKITKYYERERKYYTPMYLIWIWFFGIIAAAMILNALFLSGDRSVGESILILILGLGFGAGGWYPMWRIRRNEKKKVEDIRNGYFDVLDCQIVRIHHISYTEPTSHALVDVCDRIGTYMSQVRIDKSGAICFRDGGSPEVLLIRYKNTHEVLSEYVLNQEKK